MTNEQAIKILNDFKEFVEVMIDKMQSKNNQFGIYVVDGIGRGTWCMHKNDKRIETDEQTAKTIAILFADHQSPHIDGSVCKYEVRNLYENY